MPSWLVLTWLVLTWPVPTWTGLALQPDDNKVNANELGIDNVGGVFVVLLGGMCVAVLIAFSEFIWKSRKLAHAEHVSELARHRSGEGRAAW